MLVRFFEFRLFSFEFLGVSLVGLAIFVVLTGMRMLARVSIKFFNEGAVN